jgi:lipopolysaccharide/colanic/teichoic acid biosynthesis glycosyltransferase
MSTYSCYLNQPEARRWTESPSLGEHLGWSSSTWYDPWKAVAEYRLAVLLLVLAAPILLVGAALVKLTSSGPAFYVQTRLGRHGRRFRIYKLRSMRHQCENDSGPCWSGADDRRITPLGRLLRRSHLDELPQLWNVLRGEMSLIGPRPERPEFLPPLERALPLYRARLRIRPGMTGLAQVQQGADSNLDSVRRKLAYDLYYLRCRGPGLDARLLVATALKVIGVPYDSIGWLLTLPGVADVERAYELRIAETLTAGAAGKSPPEQAGVDHAAAGFRLAGVDA